MLLIVSLTLLRCCVVALSSCAVTLSYCCVVALSRFYSVVVGFYCVVKLLCCFALSLCSAVLFFVNIRVLLIVWLPVGFDVAIAPDLFLAFKERVREYERMRLQIDSHSRLL